MGIERCAIVDKLLIHEECAEAVFGNHEQCLRNTKAVAARGGIVDSRNHQLGRHDRVVLSVGKDVIHRQSHLCKDAGRRLDVSACVVFGKALQALGIIDDA